MHSLKIILAVILAICLCSCSDDSGSSNSDNTTVQPATTWTILGTTEVVGDNVSAVSVEDDIAYVAAGAAGLHIIDLSDPAHLQEAGYIDPHVTFSFVADNFLNVQVSDGIAYVGGLLGCIGVCMGTTEVLWTFDIAQPSSPVLLGKTEVHAFHILLDGQFVYATGFDLHPLGLKLSVIDVTDPTNLSVRGSTDIFSETGLAGQGEVIYILRDISSDQVRLAGVDVSNPDSPSLVGETITPPFNNYPIAPFAISNEAGYICLGTNEVKIIDLADPANTTSVGTFPVTSGCNDVQVSNSYMYVATDTGVWIYDISEPFNPTFIKEIPTATAAKLITISNDIGVVITEELQEPNEIGYSILEGEKLSVFKVPQSE